MKFNIKQTITKKNRNKIVLFSTWELRFDSLRERKERILLNCKYLAADVQKTKLFWEMEEERLKKKNRMVIKMKLGTNKVYTYIKKHLHFGKRTDDVYW